jgi:hypothetical protein
MSIICPGKYGVVLRKNERTAASIERLSKWVRSANRFINEDEHLAGFSVAMSYPDLMHEVRDLIAEGCERGVDFVCTVSTEGVLDKPAPSWLAMERGPTGNPPELEAKMEPDVRAMWEAQRPRLYSFAQ